MKTFPARSSEKKFDCSLAKGKEVNEVVLKLIISDENDDDADLSIPLKINGNENNNKYYSDISSDNISSQDEYM